MKRTLLQTVVFVLAATVIAVVANAMAGRERRLTLPGFYPNALRVPPRAAATPPAPPSAAAPPVAAAPATTTEQSPAPGQPPIEIPTTTIARPAGSTAAVPPAKAAPAPAVAAAPADVPVLERFKPHDKPYVEIGFADVKWLHDRGALFLDARRTAVYEEGHIAGARPFSVWESDVDEKVNRLFEERGDPEQQKQPIIIYCSGGACEDSHMLAEKLWGIQFNNVLVYKDGYPDWIARGGATRKGGTP
jgi:rhodanese-related sulfurtransferase